MLDFLFENPFLLLILIGILSSMFTSKKAKDNKSGKQQGPKKKWQEVLQELQGEWEEQKKQASDSVRPIQTEEPSKQDEARVAELKRLQQEYEEQQAALEAAKTKEYENMLANAKQIESMQYDYASTITDKASPVYKHRLKFGKEEVVQGIIMSEVLGKPRAKQSFRQQRRK